MANKTLKVNFAVPVGESVQLCYKPFNMAVAWTCLPNLLFYNQTPYDLVVNDAFTYDVSIRRVYPGCNTCNDAATTLYLTENNM